ncbi:hypothetical protein MKW98_016201 [Papaver atlanticum]|uniref:RNase H type-1 domain-containing protein n=1 Tax=Papaver atlanticum TaxID=357466 RepID=A0AAD4SID4_9MAGN|nr:hypothetical protein MKW98_016201 [Papaver atlanticum]
MCQSVERLAPILEASCLCKPDDNSMLLNRSQGAVQQSIKRAREESQDGCSEMDSDNEDQELTSTTNTSPISATQRCNSWLPPAANMVKINIDAAFGTRNSSCVAVARDFRGRFLSAGTSLSEIHKPLVAEAGGFLLAFALASRMNYKNVVIESDSQSIVRF